MDLLIKSGDLALNHQGNPIPVDGCRELAQRAAIRLATRRGSHPADPEFGSALWRLRPSGSFAAAEMKALAAVRQALAPLPQTEIRAVRCAWDSADRRLTVKVSLALRGEPCHLEVTV